MKKTFLLLFLLSTLTNIKTFSQKNEVNWSEKIESEKSKVFKKAHGFLGFSNNFYFLSSNKANTPSILTYSFNNDLKSSTIIQSPSNEKGDFKLNFVLNTKSNSYLISSKYIKKENRKTYYYSVLDDEANIENSLHELHTVNSNESIMKSSFGINNSDGENIDYSGIAISPDSTKVVFSEAISNKDSRKKSSKEIYNIQLFDDNLKKVWGKDLDFELPDQKIDIEQVEVDNNGKIWLLARVYSDKKVDKWLPKYEYNIYIIENSRISKQEIVQIKENFAVSGKLYHNINNSISLFGILKNEKYCKSYRFEHGTFLYNYDSTLKLVDSNIDVWKNNFLIELKDLYKNNFLTPMSPNINNRLKIENVHIDNKNEIVYHILEHQRSGSNNDEFSNHLLVSAYDFENKNIWNKVISKNVYGSKVVKNFESLLAKNKLFILVNNDEKYIKNVKRKERKDTFTITSKLIEMNSHGEIESNENLFTSDESGGNLSEHEFYISKYYFLLFYPSSLGSKVGVVKIK